MRAALCALGLLVCACTAAPPAGDRWASPTLEAELDPALYTFLGDLVRTVEAHDWTGFTHMVDREAYTSQLDFLSEHAPNPEDPIGLRASDASATLESALGLGYVGTGIYPAGGQRRAEAPFAGLDRIRRLTFDRVTRQRQHLTEVAGQVTLSDGSVIEMDVLVVWRSPSRPVLAIPQG